MQDTFPVCGGLGHEDPLALLKFCQFSRGDVSTWIISKGETTTWKLTRLGWDCGKYFGNIVGYLVRLGSYLIHLCGFIYNILFLCNKGRGIMKGWLGWSYPPPKKKGARGLCSYGDWVFGTRKEMWGVGFYWECG